ncbi:hypothetical protein ACFL20_06955 [Spirochaetota bacterium]
MKKLTVFVSVLVIVFALGSSRVSAMDISTFIGYNYADSELNDAVEDIYGSDAVGGVGWGFELWFGESLQYGLGIGVLQQHEVDYDFISYSFSLMPIMVNLRYYIFGGLYGGAGIGFLYGLFSDSEGNYDDSGGNMVGIQFMAGYDFILADLLIIGVTLRYTIGFEDEMEYHNFTPAITVGIRF